MGLYFKRKVCGESHRLPHPFALTFRWDIEEYHTYICPTKNLLANYNIREFTFDMEDKEFLEYTLLLLTINAFRKEKQFEKVVEFTLKSFPLIISFVKRNIELYGIQSLTPYLEFENLTTFLAILHLKDHLQYIKSQLQPIPGVRGWVKNLEHALELEKLMSKTEILLRATPGFIQGNIAKELGCDRHEADIICEQTEKLGVIKREKYLFTYKIYLAAPDLPKFNS